MKRISLPAFLISLFFFFIFYAFFWGRFFGLSMPGVFPSGSSGSSRQVLSAKHQASEEILHPDLIGALDDNIDYPAQSSKISIPPRKQAFNLSCEFAAASSILYQFTKDEKFSPQNEEKAEKILIQKIGASNNPNVGIRMGIDLPENFESLFANLNQRFGGGDYYGVHAPPFIDLFEEYELRARPISTEYQNDIKLALYNGHLVMAWISVGYKKPIDIDLSYGKVPVVRGEHTVVITGYDENGIFFMDPGIGRERYSSFENFLESVKSFPIPFLEIYPTSFLANPVESAFDKGKITGLKRSDFKISIKNGSRETGAGNELSQILKDFGWKIIDISNADNSEYEDLSINIKKEFEDYLYLLKKDLSVSSYEIGSVSASLAKEEREDGIIIVGK